MRKSALFLLAAIAVGCGPSYGAQGVKSPEEILDEQLEADDERAANETDTGGPTEDTDMDKRAQWDQHQSELELIRATRSAKQCVGVVTTEGPQGTAKVTLTFSPDGNVKASDINSPFKDTPLGKCILNAMAAVVVPPFSGEDHIVDWDVDLDAKDEGGE